jgi:hypothetical protein
LRRQQSTGNTPTTTTGVLSRQGAYDASMSTPTLAYGADFICRHCGAEYVVSYTKLPIADRGGEFEYRIKSANEPHERVVQESELRDL